MNRFVHPRRIRKDSRRRLLLENLELRLSPALLAAGADAGAFARYYSTTDGPYQVSDPVSASAAAVASPSQVIFQVDSHAAATVGGSVVSMSRAGGADANTIPPTDTIATSNAESTSNWIVSGPLIQGQPVTVDVTVNINGSIRTNDDPLIQPSDILSRVSARLDLASDFAADQTLLDASAELRRSPTVNGPWTFSQPNPLTLHYDTSYSATFPITVEALQPFSLRASLETEARTAFTFEYFALADFESAGGFTYTLSTNTPGASINPVGSGGQVDGILWNDLNADGIEDPNEGRLSGFRFFLDSDGNGILDPATEPSGLTDANGAYSIANVPPGAYNVSLLLPVGWEQTSPLDTTGNPTTDTVVVSDAMITTAQPFGARGIPYADLEISVSNQPISGTVNQPFTYIVNVTNNGPATADAVTVTTTLDPDLVFMGATAGGPPCSESGGVVTCQLGDLASGDSMSFSFDVVPVAAPSVSSTLTVASNTADPSNINNSVSVLTDVNFRPASYLFTVLDEFVGGRVGAPSLNDNGSVIFVRESTDRTDDTIYFADKNASAPVLSKLATFPPPSQGELQIELSPVMNNDGTFAFRIVNQGPPEGRQSGVYTFDTAGILTPIRPLGGPSGYTISIPFINNIGTVVYADRTATDGSEFIYAHLNGQRNTIADNLDGKFDNVFMNDPNPSINDAGFVVFAARPAGGFRPGLYTSDGSTTSVIIDPAMDTRWNRFRDPSIGANGDVLVVGDYLISGQTIISQNLIRSNGGSLDIVADTDNSPFRNFFDSAIQSDGSIVFAANLDNGGDGVYTGPNTLTDKIVAPGDTLFGLTVSSAWFQRSGTNSQGQIAMTLNMTNNRRLVVIADRDLDGDGISDQVEAAGPNGGDANNDGRPDSMQANVASLPNLTDGSYVSFESPVGTSLVGVSALQTLPPGAPTGIALPDGLFNFEVHGIQPGGAVDVLMHRESSTTVTEYYKFGPTANNPLDHWYPFGFVPNSPDPDLSGTGAEVLPFGNVTVLHFVDGRRGDADGSANGVIVDPGGPAYLIAPPVVEIDGPASGVRGEPLHFEFSVSTPGEYTYEIDWDGDGTVDESISGNESLSAEYVYESAGDYSVVVTVTNSVDVSTVSDPHDVSIDIVALRDGDLIVGGTTERDRIRFYRAGHNRVGVRLNHERFGPFELATDSRLIAYGQDGNDRIDVAGYLPYDVSFFGGAGRDVLIGGRGNDILIGGQGRDLLLGGRGQDLLIGGRGRDRLLGGFGEDLLIGGSTVYDDDHDLLLQILDLWTQPLPYAQRVETLQDDSQPLSLVPNVTVLNDDAVDRLFGGFCRDWIVRDGGRDR